MDVDRIREQLKVRGYDFSQIARVLGVSPAYVSNVARRTRQSHPVAVAIATALDKPVDRVFPDIPMYHGPILTNAEREQLLAEELVSRGVIRRSA